MKIVYFFWLFLFFISCKETVLEKPVNVIEKDKMIGILYDIAILDVVKSQNIKGGISDKEIQSYLFKKHKIDSIQFTKSNKFYASDVAEYKKMFEIVQQKLKEQKEKISGVSKTDTKSTQNSDTPAVY